jgi:hypothetical protein
MTPRRIVFNWTPKGWAGWILLALAALPFVVLTFFFFALMLTLFTVVLLIGVARVAWYRYRGWDPRQSRRSDDESDTFTVASVREVSNDAPECDGNRPTPAAQLLSGPSRDSRRSST